jgi:hypothetical protein
MRRFGLPGFVLLVGALVVSLSSGSALAGRHKPTEYSVLVKVMGANAQGSVVPITDAEVSMFPGETTSTNASGLAPVRTSPSTMAGDYVTIVVKADGYRTARLRYLIDEKRAVLTLPGPTLSRKLIAFLIGEQDTVQTFVLERGSDAPEGQVDLTIRVVDEDGKPVPKAIVKLCCSSDAPIGSYATDKAGESSYFIKRSAIEAGLQARVSAADGRAKFSDISTSVLNGTGERIFLVILPNAHTASGFAGGWSTFGGNGKLGLEVVNTTKGEAAVSFYSGGSAKCPTGTIYYTGFYQASGDSGQVAGCTDSTGRHLMGWYKSGPGPQHGTISLTISSDGKTFSGSYNEQSGQGGSGPYAGTRLS